MEVFRKHKKDMYNRNMNVYNTSSTVMWPFTIIACIDFMSSCTLQPGGVDRGHILSFKSPNSVVFIAADN